MTSNNRILSLFASFFITGLMAQTNQEPVWSILAHATVSDHVTDLWVTPQGESYMFGNISYMPSSPALDGMMLVKANSDGQEVWRKYYHPQDNNYQLFSQSIVGDGNGNVFLIYTDDYRYTDLNSTRIAVKKIDPDGNVIWSNFYTEVVENLVESPRARSGVYKNGKLYFVSTTGGIDPSDDLDAMIVKIDAGSGNLIQKIVFNSQYDTDDFFREVMVSDNGEMWAIGRSRGYMYPGGIYSDYDSNVVKYSADGQFQWEHRTNGTSNSEDYGINAAIDPEGNTYTSSQLRMLGINQRRVNIQKISPTGTVLWDYYYQGSSSGYTHDQPILVLPNGNVVFSASNEDGIVTKALNGMTGEELWSQNYNRSAAGAANRPYNMRSDAAGNIYIAGQSRDNTPFGAGWDAVTIKYSADGELLWIGNFNRGDYATSGETSQVLKMDAMGNVYVAGGSQLGESANYDSDFFLLKYGVGNLAVSTNDALPYSYYPNPTENVINITTSESVIEKVVLYDLYGHLVHQWQDIGNSKEISLDMGEIAPGVYLVVVSGEGRSQNLKIMKK